MSIAQKIAIAGVLLGFLFGVYALFAALESEPEPPPEEELDKALQAYERQQKRNGSEPSTVRPAPRRRSLSSGSTAGQESGVGGNSEDSRTPAIPGPRGSIDAPKRTLGERMDAANKLYDIRDYEAAKAAAFEILAEHPDNVRMLRIIVSSECIMANPENAAKYYAKLPARDQGHMRTRCKRYGVEF